MGHSVGRELYMTDVDLSKQADGGQARHDRALEFLTQKRDSLTQELKASRQEGDPIGPKEEKLVAQLMAVDIKIGQLDNDMALLQPPKAKPAPQQSSKPAPQRPSKPAPPVPSKPAPQLGAN